MIPEVYLFDWFGLVFLCRGVRAFVVGGRSRTRPADNLDIIDAGIFWPEGDEPLFSIVGDGSAISSDHRLVWVDIEVDNTHPPL